MLVLALLLPLALGIPYTPTQHGIVFAVQNYSVELAVASKNSFRLSVSFDGAPASQWPTRMVAAEQEYPDFSIYQQKNVTIGLNSTFGYINVNTQTGAWDMGDSNGSITSFPILASSSNNNLDVALGQSSSALFYGSGGGLLTVSSLTATASNPLVQNRAFFVPHFWSTDGFAALGVASSDYVPSDLSAYPAKWKAANTTGSSTTFSFSGSRADLYLMPARTLLAGTQAYYVLTGLPPVPPRYTFGFLASRWGWLDRKYIQDTLETFRNGSYPIDAFICDFEWYTLVADYTLPSGGAPWFEDFSYSPITYPDPVDQLRQYHNDLHVRFGGIRKPRLGNSVLLDLARSRGWLIQDGRNLNYSIPEVREWYGNNIGHFLEEGVDFWWNDEGETQYYTFFDWNTAQHNTSAVWRPNKRFFTINRSFSPGMQRLGTVVWTGDTPVSWQALRRTGGYLNNWMLAGAGYVTCDIGGFDGLDDPPDLLVRWYQLGVFLPVMRVHSTKIDRPHWPWLYGPGPAAIMRDALNLRHQLVPYYYSLAHNFSQTGTPFMQPLVMAYPGDALAANITTQWLIGDIMPAPVVEFINVREIYLPAGMWYFFNSTDLLTGARTFYMPVDLDQIPILVRAGSVVTLAPVVQYTDELPGGPLIVHVYPGGDATFTLVEDDGETYDYKQGVTREILFSWTDDNKTLIWTTATAPLDTHGFTQLVVHAFYESGELVSQVTDINFSGRVSF